MQVNLKFVSIVFLAILVIFCALSCDKGLAPTQASPPRHGISGTIYFKHWPPVDSIFDLRLVAFKNYPIQDIANEVLQGRAQFTDTLKPYGIDSIAYTLFLTNISPGIIPCVAVGQRYGTNLFKDWRIVGFYYSNNDTTRPGSINVPPDSIVSGINIQIDFNHLPPQP